MVHLCGAGTHAPFRLLVMEWIMSKKCQSCGCPFIPRPQTPNQAYCSSLACQRERRRRWQERKRRDDPDYRDNDRRASKAWATAHPDYWKRYRDTNPAYVDRNRNLQQKRNRKLRSLENANEDVSPPPNSPPSGRYRLLPLSEEGIANGDAWIVEITVLPSCVAVEDA